MFDHQDKMCIYRPYPSRCVSAQGAVSESHFPFATLRRCQRESHHEHLGSVHTVRLELDGIDSSSIATTATSADFMHRIIFVCGTRTSWRG